MSSPFIYAVYLLGPKSHGFANLMLHGLQMRLSHKIGPGVIFCIATIIVVFDIVRVSESLNSCLQLISATFSFLETEIAVIVSTLPTYHMLLGTQARQRFGRYARSVYKSTAGGRLLRSKANSRFGKKLRGPYDTLYGSAGHTREALVRSNDVMPPPREHLEEYNRYTMRDLEATGGDRGPIRDC